MGTFLKRFRHLGSLLTLLMVFSARLVMAQGTSGTISGRITDKETQAPIAGVTVQATTASGRVVGSATTDADGNYRISVPAGSYSVVVAMVGYQTERSSVRVVSGESSIAGLALTTEAFLLNPVVVSASR